jgi:voltage-gated potassium channel
VLIVAICLSVFAVLLESVPSLRESYGFYFLIVEWFFTIIFTIEYILRLICVRNRKKYAFSFFGIIDLVAILPTYLSFFFVGAQSLLVVRSFRLLRIFRVFKLTHYLAQANILSAALRASRPKIIVFLVAVIATVITVGAMMYLIEGPENGFTSIPESIYWAIVTMTTVGFGDITPHTVLGRMLAAVLMIMGYGILAVPTGIVSVELARADRAPKEERRCEGCKKTETDPAASYCRYCGKEF